MGVCVHSTQQWRGLVYRQCQSDCLVSLINVRGVKTNNQNVNIHISNLKSYHVSCFVALCCLTRWPGRGQQLHSSVILVLILLDQQLHSSVLLESIWLGQQLHSSVILVSIWLGQQLHSSVILVLIWLGQQLHSSVILVSIWLGQQLHSSVILVSIWTRRPKYVWRNIEARSCSHCCSGKAMSIAQPGCVFVALGIQHAKIIICGLWPAPLCKLFPHYLINGTIFGKKVVHKMCVSIFSTAFVWNIFHSKKNCAKCNPNMYIDLHVQYRLLSDFNDISVYLSRYLTNLMHKIYFTISFISCLYMCVHQQEVKIALHSLWYHHTYRRDDARGYVMQFLPPDDEHMCSKHVEAWNKTYCETNFVHQVG